MIDTTDGMGMTELFLEDSSRHLDQAEAGDRGAGAANADEPVGGTGLYWRRFHIRGSRENPVIMEEYLMDHKILREILRVEEQARIATGN